MSTVTRAVCRECGEAVSDPIIGECHCGSRYIRGVDPIEDALRDAMDSLNQLLKRNEADRDLILAAMTKVTFAMGVSS